MIKHNQNGQVQAAVVGLVLTTILLLAAVAFSAWSFSSRQDYKNNADQKISDAVVLARQQEDSLKDKAFTEANKSPLRPYNGPEAYGSINLQYPKTWSGYVDDTGAGASFVDGYFYPGSVPSVTNPSSVFALRVQVLNQQYSQTLANVTSGQQDGKLTIEAYALPKVPKVVGVKVTGTFPGEKVAQVIILPLRNQTIQISTQGTQFRNDFDTYILPNFSFSP